MWGDTKYYVLSFIKNKYKKYKILHPIYIYPIAWHEGCPRQATKLHVPLLANNGIGHKSWKQWKCQDT